jgi:hypothetical protein
LVLEAGSCKTTALHITNPHVALLSAESFFASFFGLSVTSTPMIASNSMRIWDVGVFPVVNTDEIDKRNSVIREKGQESSLWDFKCDVKNYYHIIPYAMKKGQKGSYILRIYADKPIFLETVPNFSIFSAKGEWRKLRDRDSTGGNMSITQVDGTVKENPKWCQNPQYHLQLENQFRRDFVNLKIILRRTDKPKKDAKKRFS